MKLGSYSIPKYRLVSLLDDTKRMYERFKSDENSNDLIASFLGHSPTSGGFFQKLADLRAFGLIEGRGGKSKVTKLGIDATLGINNERNLALAKIVKNIPLWGILYEKYGKEIHVDNFWIDVEKITGIERVDAQKNAEYIRNAYNEDAKYINIVEKPKEPVDQEISQPRAKGMDDRSIDMETTTVTNLNKLVMIKYPGIGTITLDLNDEVNVSIAENILNTIRAKLKKSDVNTTPLSIPPIPPDANDGSS